jgi:hypothetical protein
MHNGLGAACSQESHLGGLPVATMLVELAAYSQFFRIKGGGAEHG